MNVVTRNTINFKKDDQPFIDLEINGSHFLIHFNKTLHFLKPSNYKAISADESLDLRVHKSTWWLVTDINTDTCSEISSTWNGDENGFRVSYISMKTGTSVSFRITQSESNEILGYIESMILQAVIDTGGHITKESVLIYRPSLKLLDYRVTPLQYIHNSKEAMPFLQLNAPILKKPTTKNLNIVWKAKLVLQNGMPCRITV